MQIETERLILETFSLQLIDAALAKDHKKIKEIGYKVSAEWPEADLVEALPFFRDLIVSNGINGFNSWLIIDKNTKEIVGSIGYIGNPDSQGNTEIGFGIIPGKRRNGYCCEAANALIKWAMNDEKVKCIKARCEESNQASKSIICKLGFKVIKTEDGFIDWEYRYTWP